MADLSSNTRTTYSLSPIQAVNNALGMVGSAVSDANQQIFGAGQVAGSISFTPTSITQTGAGSWQMGGGLNFDLPIATIQTLQNQALQFTAANAALNKAGINQASTMTAVGIAQSTDAARSGIGSLANQSAWAITNAGDANRAYLDQQTFGITKSLANISGRAMGLTSSAIDASRQIAMRNAQVAEFTAHGMFATLQAQAIQQTEQVKATTAAQGGKKHGPCYITTAMCEGLGLPDNCHYLTALRKFRDDVMLQSDEWAPLVAEYYRSAPEIVAKIDARVDKVDVYGFIRQWYIEPCVRAIESDRPESAIATYQDMLDYLANLE